MLIFRMDLCIFHVKVLIGAFNLKKAIVGYFSMIVKPSRTFVESSNEECFLLNIVTNWVLSSSVQTENNINDTHDISGEKSEEAGKIKVGQMPADPTSAELTGRWSRVLLLQINNDFRARIYLHPSARWRNFTTCSGQLTLDIWLM